MTYCPKCGTANRDGSRFCNQCGELLSTEKQVQCPQCGTLNPGQNLLCTECGARLEPASESTLSPGGLSPSAKAGSDVDDNEELQSPSGSQEDMPAWLRDLGATFTPDEQPTPESLDEPAEIPAWLQDLRASIPAESREGMEQEGDRERDTASFVPPSPSEGRQAAPFPSETEEKEDRSTEPAEPVVPLPGDKEEPDWLAELQTAPEGREPPAVQDLPDTEEGEPPDWLARLQPTEGVRPEKRTRPAQSAAPEATPSTGDETGPGWLEMDSLPEVEEDLEPELPAFDADDEDSLDWLAELIPPPAESGASDAQPTSEPGEEQAPDWLAELDSSAQESKPKPEPRSPEAESTDIPDWFTELQSSVGDSGLDRETPISEAVQSPDWLDESPIPAPEQDAEPELEASLLPVDAEETGKPGQPEGLLVSAVMASDAFDSPEGEAAEETTDESIPFPPSSIEGEEETELYDAAGEDVELSEWLAELRPPISEIEVEPTAPVMEEQTEELVEQLSEPSEAVVPHATPATSEEALPGSDVPPWLAEMQAEGHEETPGGLEEAAVESEPVDWLVPPEQPTEEGELERADIPAWLMALKPPELREEGEPAESMPIEEGIERDTGLLSGLEGTLPVEMIIAQPRAVTAARPVERSITETEHTRLFRDIVGRVPEAVPRQIAQAPARPTRMLPSWLLYLVLIVVVSLPLLLREPLFIRTIEPAQATTHLYTAIEALGSNAAVLVAFDYDPTTSGEMEVISQALVGHLMDRGAKVVAMSLLPAGPATAQPLLEALAADRPDYADSYGQRYVNLGYLPGQAAAVRLVGLSPERAFESDFQGTPLADLPVMDGITSAEDFDLVLELAARQDSVRWWIEQASMPYEVRLGAGVSAPVAPLTQPYYETDPRQLVGLVGGVPGAVTYEALHTEQGSPAQSVVSRLDSQMAGQLLLVFVLLVGNGIFLVQRGARR
jgi:hypothetical protein